MKKNRTKYYVVSVNFNGEKGFAIITEDRRGSDLIRFKFTSSRQTATFTDNYHTAKRWASIIERTIKKHVSIEDLDYKKNPSQNGKRTFSIKIIYGHAVKWVTGYRKIPFLSKFSYALTGNKGKATLFSDYAKAYEIGNLIKNSINHPTEVVPNNEPTYKKRLSAYKRNPGKHAPGPAERSEKYHKIRKPLEKKLKFAKRKDAKEELEIITRKLNKLDRIFSAPRNLKRRK